MPVLVEEMNGSPVLARTKQGITSTHKYLIAWDQRDELLKERLNQEYSSSLWVAFGTSVSIQPWGKMLTDVADKTKAVYEKALATVVYTTPSPYDLANPTKDNTFTERIAGNAEHTTISPEGFQWGPGANADALSEDEAPGRLTIGLDYFYTRHNISYVPLGVLDAMSCVNDADVQPEKGSPYAGLSFPKETLLFFSPTISAVTSSFPNPGSQFRVTVEYHFSFRPNYDRDGGDPLGWNAWWRPQANSGLGGYMRIYPPGGTGSDYYRNFPSKDFEWVFSGAG